MGKKFVVYLRVSTKRQGASGLGLEAQEAAVAAFFDGTDRERIATYKEIESGTRKGNARPELAAALAHAKRAGAELVIAKWDRLGRNVAFVSNLMESGIDFVALDLPSANRFTLHIMAAVAEEEARVISERTKAALAAAKARGKKLGNPQNLTAEAQAKSAAVNRAKALDAYGRIAHLIANLRVQGHGYSFIARHLNELGERTRTGAAFTDVQVRRIHERTTAATA